MRKFTVIAPDDVTLADVRAMLPGCTVSEVKVKAKAAKPDADYEPVIVYKNGEVLREIDGVSAQKAIAKIMAETRKGQNSDGRGKHVYPNYEAMVERLKKDPMANADHDYAKVFCQNLHLKPAKYINGVTA